MASTKTPSARAARSRRTAKPGGGAAFTRATSLLGREKEISGLSQLSKRERLITLTGAPGIGKSRLALELATQLGGDYPGGALLVELAPLSRSVEVPRALARALSVDELAGEPLIDTIARRIGKRRMLVVLDNCEHLLGACAKLVEALLSGCPELRVVATSREPLGVDGEAAWQVPPLSVPEPEEKGSPQALVSHAAVALFVERAATAQPGFSLNAYVAPAVAEITRRLDGIPLAIELGAARVESLTPEEIARRLDDRFGLLTKAGESSLAHHQTLESALDWSHELLSEPERTLLRRLSVFSAGFELEAAEVVCAGGEMEAEEVPELIGELMRKSLVVAHPRDPSVERYRLLETIRAYAGDRLDHAGEAAGLRAAHARFYLRLAERTEPELTGPRQVECFERLEAEHANLRSAIEWSLSHREEDVALRLAGALVLFWRVRCHFTEGRELLEAALSANEGAAPALRAKGLWGEGLMTLMAGDPDGAVPLEEESLELSRELGDPQGHARALLILGNCVQHANGDRSLALLEESAALARDAGDLWCESHALALAGFSHRSREDLAAARPLFEQCIQVARRAQDKQGLRFGLLGLGSVASGQCDFRWAESLLQEAVLLTEELGESYSKAVVLHELGTLTFFRGKHRRAAELLDEGISLVRKIGNPSGLSRLLVDRARVAHAEGDRARARSLFEEVLLDRSGGGSGRAESALLGLAELSAEEGKVGAARGLLEEALEPARARGDRRATALVLRGLGELARSEGDSERAAVLCEEALVLQFESGSVLRIVPSIEAVAGIALDEGRHTHAARLLGAATAQRSASGYARTPAQSSRYAADLARIRRGLSDEEVNATLAEGAALSLAQAAAQASTWLASRSSMPIGWSSLTERERQVAFLVADGLTNPEIAQRLGISRATVKTYVSRILSKLEVTGRTQLAGEVWRRQAGGTATRAMDPPR